MNLRKAWFKFRHPIIVKRLSLARQELEVCQHYHERLKQSHCEFSFEILEIIMESVGKKLPATLTKNRVFREANKFTIIDPVDYEPDEYVFDEERYPQQYASLTRESDVNYAKHISASSMRCNLLEADIRNLIKQYNIPEGI